MTSLDPKIAFGAPERRPPTNSSSEDSNIGSSFSDRNPSLGSAPEGPNATNASTSQPIVGAPLSRLSPTASPTLPSAANSVPPSPVPGGIESNSTTPFIPASSPSPTASPVISLNPPPKSNVTNPNFSSSLTATLSTPSPITPDRNIPVVSTLTSTVSFQAHHPAPTSNHNTTSLPPHTEDHGGLSSGAITAIAVIAGIIGFVLLFWVGVQILQSKRRKREEAEMQEIDFDPSGNGSAIGDSTFPRTTVTHRQDSFNTVQDSTSYLNHKGGGRDLHDGQFDEGPRMYDESEYIDTGGYSVAGYPGYGTGVQRQYSTGSSANNFYVDSRQQAVAHGYSAYPAQYPASSAAHYDTSAVSPQHYYGQQTSGYNSNSGRDYNRQPRGDYSQSILYQSPVSGGDSRTAVSSSSERGGGYGNMIARATTPPQPSEVNSHFSANPDNATK